MTELNRRASIEGEDAGRHGRGVPEGPGHHLIQPPSWVRRVLATLRTHVAVAVRPDRRHPSRWIEPRAPHRVDGRRPGPVDRPGAGQEGGDRRGQRRRARPVPRAGRRRHRSPSSPPTRDQGLLRHPPLDGPRAGPGGARAVPRRHLRHRPAGRERLLLRLRAARRRHVPRGRPRPHRGPDARDPGRVAAVREVDEIAADVAREIFADHPYKLEIIDDASTDPMSATSERGEVRCYENIPPEPRPAPDLPRPRRLHRPVPRPPRAHHQRPPRPLQAAPGRRRLLEGRARRTPSSSASTARRGPARPSSTPTSTASRRRPSATTASSAPSSTCSASPTRSAPAWPCSIPRAASSAAMMEDYSRRRHEEAGYEFVYSPHITKENLFETSGHLQWFADGMFPPMHFDDEGGPEGTDYYLKPMNCPFHCLIFRVAAAELPRAAAAAVRVRLRVPLREVRGGPRPHPGPGHDPGRRPHLLHPGADGRRAGLAARLRARPAAGLRPRRLLPRAVDQAGGEGHRLRRGVGGGHRDPAPGRRGQGPRAGARRGRRRLLRAQDLGPGPRRHRPHLADVHHPARLPGARSASGSSTSAPTTSATSRS